MFLLWIKFKRDQCKLSEELVGEEKNLLKISKEHNSADIWWTVTLNKYELLDIMV